MTTTRNTAFLAALAFAVVLAAVTPHALAQKEDPTDQDAGAHADTTGLALLSSEELFLRASSSALQFQHLIAPSRRLLVRNHAESVPVLVTKLDTDSPRERLALEDVLLKVGDAAVQPLIDALGAELVRDDTSRGVRLAASILGRLGDERGGDALVAAARHHDWKVRSAAAEALGRIAAPGPVPTLTLLLGDANEVVRKSAAAALARVAERGGHGLDESAVAGLTAALSDPNYSVRYGAARALAQCGDRAWDRLERLALDGEGPARLMALRALGEIGSPRARGVLRELLESESWVVRAHAATALGSAGPDRAARRKLESMLGDRHPLPAFAAARALRESP
ncbi:MAG: HEAT repeat domain-containing protein [Candidatus Eisenbacteria bacterium]